MTDLGILFINFKGGARMRKPLNNKKDKVPKISEEEYSEYISHLRESSENNPLQKENPSVKQNESKQK